LDGFALVTGASSGIGLELSRLLASGGHNLILVARNEVTLRRLARELESAYGKMVHIVAKDLADPASPAAIHAFCMGRGLPVDILVNNAGFATNGPFAATDLPTELAQMQVNVVALTHLSKLFLPEMLALRRGRILNVASTAGFQPGPYMAVYYASKAYVVSLSEAMAEEVRGTGVSVTVLCPGPTRTDFQRRAGMENVAIAKQAFMMDAAAVAQAGYDGMMHGTPIVIPGLSNKAGALLVKFVPRAFSRRLVGMLNKRKE